MNRGTADLLQGGTRPGRTARPLPRPPRSSSAWTRPGRARTRDRGLESLGLMARSTRRWSSASTPAGRAERPVRGAAGREGTRASRTCSRASTAATAARLAVARPGAADEGLGLRGGRRRSATSRTRRTAAATRRSRSSRNSSPLEGGTPTNTERVEVGASSATVADVGWADQPGQRDDGADGLPYIVAVALTDGEVFTEQFQPDRIGDPALVELSRRVSVRATSRSTPRAVAPARDPDRGPPHRRPPAEARGAYARGKRRAPLTDDEARPRPSAGWTALSDARSRLSSG